MSVEEHLPLKINSLALAKKDISFSGQLLIKNMPRLSSMLADNEGIVDIKALRFATDEEGQPYISGCLKASLILTCQRCLQAMQYEIDDNIALGIALSDNQAKILPEYYEPLLIEEEEQELLSIIEDELLVRIPIVAKHLNQECAKEQV